MSRFKEKNNSEIIKSLFFQLQPDESIDAGNEPQLMVCCRFPGVEADKTSCQQVGDNQGRNERSARGAQFPGRWITAGGYEWLRGATNDCGGRRKVATMSQVLSSIQYICFQKDHRIEHGGAKLASCPGRHLTSLRPWRQCSCCCDFQQSKPRPL